MNRENIILKCQNLSKRFNFFFALKNISFEVEKNTIFGILGANGAGKTTLIKLLSGIISPSEGEITISNMNFNTSPQKIRKKIGILIENSFLYEELTIYENLKFYFNMHYIFDKEKITMKVEELVKQFELTEWLHEPIQNLSKGMKQKVEIIRAIMINPPILLLDEPFSGLDYNATNSVVNLLENLLRNKNTSIILTTHKITIAKQICDNLLILKNGKLKHILGENEIKSCTLETYF